MKTALATVLFSIVVVTGRPLSATTYQLTDLGTLGGASSQAFGLNIHGDVVGSSDTSSGQTHAFLYHNGTMTDLGVLNATDDFSQALSINDSGVIVGNTQQTGVKSTAFYYSGGQMHQLNGLGGNYFDFAQGINDAGQIVGISGDKNGVTHAFLSYNNVPTDLGSLSLPGYSNAVDINSAGDVTGFSTDANNLTHGFIYKNGKMSDLGTLPNGQNTATAFAINDQDQVTGYSTPSSSSPLTDAVLWENGMIIDLGTLPGVNSSFGRGINDLGQIVGSSGDAFIWTSSTGMQDLNTMLNSSGAGWTLAIAYDINDVGQIAGMGYDPLGNQRAFLLTPVPEPSALILSGLGGLALSGVAIRRRRIQAATGAVRLKLLDHPAVSDG